MSVSPHVQRQDLRIRQRTLCDFGKQHLTAHDIITPYVPVSVLCLEVSECRYRNGGCLQYCTDLPRGAGVQCGCADGFELDIDGKSCRPTGNKLLIPDLIISLCNQPLLQPFSISYLPVLRLSKLLYFSVQCSFHVADSRWQHCTTVDPCWISLKTQTSPWQWTPCWTKTGPTWKSIIRTQQNQRIPEQQTQRWLGWVETGRSWGDQW